MGFKSLVVGWVLIGLCVVAALTFAVNMEQLNNGQSTLQSNSIINNTVGNLGKTLGGSQANGSAGLSSIQQDTPISGGFGIIVFAFKAISTGFATVLIGAYNGTFGLIFGAIFGSDSGTFAIVTGVLTFILLIALIIALIRVFAGTGD